jgi:hypothetical protein
MFVLIVTKEEEDYGYDSYTSCCCCSTTTYKEQEEVIAYFSTEDKAQAFVDSCRRKGSKTIFRAASPFNGVSEWKIKEVTSFDPKTYLTM